MERRLAAILAADVIGYSRLMGQDEARTLERLKAVLDRIVRPEIDANGGRIVKLMGDGVLAEFSSVVGAAKCALAVRAGLIADQAEVPDAEKILLRMGINLGDIIVDGDDIHGDGVNVAARLEALAEPNTIFVSGAVYDQLHAKLPVVFDALGKKAVKNIREPIRVYRLREGGAQRKTAAGISVPGYRRRIAIRAASAAIIVGGAFVAYLYLAPSNRDPVRQDALAKSEGRPTVTVLPLSIIGDDSRDQYFATGISQDITAALTHLSDLMVIAPSRDVGGEGNSPSAVLARGNGGARFVVGGTLARIDDMLRISVELVDTATGETLWLQTYNRSRDALASLAGDILDGIVPRLPVKQTDQHRAATDNTHFPKPLAYDLYLKGNLSFARFSPPAIEEAKQYYRDAAQIDPDYAKPPANLAFATALSVQFGWSATPEQDLVEVDQLIDRALKLDPDVHQAYLARGVSLRSQRHYEEAIAALKKALEIAPNHADAYAMISITYVFAGHPEEGLSAIENAMVRDPNHPFYYLYDKAMALFHLDRFEEAVAPLLLALQKNPDFLPARLLLASTYAHLGRLDDAGWEYQEVLARKPDFTLLQEQARIPYADPNDLFRYMDGLRTAAGDLR